MVLAHGDGVPIYRHIYIPDIRNSCVSPVIIPLSDGEWHKTIHIPTGLGDDILACALEVIIVTIKCVVVGVTPSPADACVLGDAHSFTLLYTALLLGPTLCIFAGIYTK